MLSPTPVLGLCRFSFVGRGDWGAYRDRNVDHKTVDFRAEIASRLYRVNRMERRLFSLEKFLLTTLDAQTDTAFHLIILTSDLMPKFYQERLRALCEPRAYATLVVSAAQDVDAGFLPEIERIQGSGRLGLMQFRIDDDDCLCPTYVQQLRQAAQRFEDMPAVSYSIPKGLVATAYTDQPQRFYELQQPFHSGGCAVRPHRRDRTVYSYGHFALGRRFPAMLDNAGFGHLALKLDDQDSEKLHNSPRALAGHSEIDKGAFLDLLRAHFPAVDPADLTRIHQMGRVAVVDEAGQS